VTGPGHVPVKPGERPRSTGIRGILISPAGEYSSRLWQAVITVHADAIFFITAASSLAILIAGCVGSITSPPLVGTAWILEEIRDDHGDLVPVLTGTYVTAAFSAEGRITGSAGCNRYFAGYSLSGNRIAISDAGSTKMFCSDPEGIMVQETRFLEHLTASTGYRIEKVTLSLLGEGDRPLLVFHRGTAARETGSPPAP